MFDPANLVTRLTASSYQLFQFPKITALSALLLLALAPSAQAVSINNAKNISTVTFADTFIIASKSQTTSCDNDIKLQTSKQQNSRRQNIDCMLTQLRVYQRPTNHTSRQQYFAYKAQAWLNYACHEDSLNSRSPAGEHALQSGITILKALQQTDDKNLRLTTDIPATSALMRPDLWATLIALKDSGGITTAPRELAFSEVALTWAAANHCDHDWRQAATQFRMVDRWLEQAREAYVNDHDSKTNVALEALINSYYKQFAPLNPSDDSCHGQVLPLNSQTLGKSTDTSTNTSIHSRLSFPKAIPMPTPTATYNIVY